MTETSLERLVEVRIPSIPDRLKLLRSIVRDVSMECGCMPDCSEEIVIAINEACMNVMRHGYGSAQDKDIIIELHRRGSDLVFKIMDFAAPVDESRIRPRPIEDVRPGGLGTHFIQELMDDARYMPAPPGIGNVFQMTKKIS